MAVPGWYQSGAQLRYWDGRAWTDHVAPSPAASHRQSTVVSADGLPFRFLAPFDWPEPPRSWRVQWAGMDIPRSAQPSGYAPAPPGWVFWEPTDLRSSAWWQAERSRLLRNTWIWAAVALLALIVSTWATAQIAERGGYVIFWGAVVFGTVYAIRGAIRYSELGADPWAYVRKRLAT